jgi:DNA polymerase-3 subunit delta'
MGFQTNDLIGQVRVKQILEQIVNRNRIAHAYLFSGPKGSGLLPFALRFAEQVNITDSSHLPWFKHPDIHVFLPMPSSSSIDDLNIRLDWLKEDAYALVEYADRPDNEKDRSKNKQAFYSIDYFRSDIRPVTRLRPFQGKKVVVIMTMVETMRKETANSFLKLLEEPSDGVMFILTTHHYEQLLPTITSRCQHIAFGQNTLEEVEQALIHKEGIPEQDAKLMVRLTQGNYSKTKTLDVADLQGLRNEVIDFLRKSFVMDASAIQMLIQHWTASRNIEGLIQLVELMESFLRDLIVYQHSQTTTSLIHADALEIIENIIKHVTEGNFEQMISLLHPLKKELAQNVNPRLLFTVLSLNYSRLMRGLSPKIESKNAYKHLPSIHITN